MSDSEAIAGVLGVSFGWAMPHLANLHAPAENLHFVREQLLATTDIWGADENGRLVGYIALKPQWVEHLYVLPECVGRGIGTALLDLAKARDRQVSLWTFQANRRARAFYEAHSFVEVARTDGSGNSEREPDVLYRWHQE